MKKIMITLIICALVLIGVYAFNDAAQTPVNNTTQDITTEATTTQPTTEATTTEATTTEATTTEATTAESTTKETTESTTKETTATTTKAPVTTTAKPVAPGSRLVALTFDDGPSEHTGRLLDILNKHGAKATFFVVGREIPGREALLKRMVAEGHEIGNHTQSHKNLTKISESEAIKEITSTRTQIKNITGKDISVVRPPEGAYNEKVGQIGSKLGTIFVNWNIDSRDWQKKTSDSIYKEIIDYVSHGSIVLCHDLHKTTVDSIERVIVKLIEDGYTLVTVSEILEKSGKNIRAGEIYYRG